jgi:hypothetical protein
MVADISLGRTNALLLALVVSVAVVILLTPHQVGPAQQPEPAGISVRVAARYRDGGPAAGALVRAEALSCAPEAGSAPAPGPATEAATDMEGVAELALGRAFTDSRCASLRVEGFKAERAGAERAPGAEGWWGVASVESYRAASSHEVRLELVSTRVRPRGSGGLGRP